MPLLHACTLSSMNLTPLRHLSICLVSLFAVCRPSLSNAEQGVTKTKLPKVYFSDTSRLGRPFAKDPSVIQFKGRFYLYYSLPPHPGGDRNKYDESGWGVGIAESRDLIHWKKAGELAPSGGIESKGIAAPGARVIGGRVHLFYQTYGRGSQDEICHAVSEDGIHFKKDPSNPIFHPVKASWSVGRAIDAEVITIPESHKAYLYYATRDPKMEKQLVGVAEADLESGLGAGAWHDVSTDAPVLAPTLPWEEICIEAPTVVKHDGRYYMFYAGAYNNRPQQIGVAVSDDAVHFTRLSDQPFLPNGKEGSWNSSESGHPGVLQAGGSTYLFFQGNADHGKTYFISAVRIRWVNGKPQVDPNWGL
jgi:predicted GH43/DUF377 family glycosyl hydrolase